MYSEKYNLPIPKDVARRIRILGEHMITGKPGPCRLSSLADVLAGVGEEEEIEIVNIDVDTNNTYFAEGILVHNKGSSASPVDNAAHNTLTHAIENPGTGSLQIS